MTARYRIMCPRSAHPLSFIINQIRISPGINDIRLPVYTSRILHVFPHPSAQTTFPCRRHINRVGLSCPLSETKCKPELYHSCLTIPKLFPNISFYLKSDTGKNADIAIALCISLQKFLHRFVNTLCIQTIFLDQCGSRAGLTEHILHTDFLYPCGQFLTQNITYRTA